MRTSRRYSGFLLMLGAVWTVFACGGDESKHGTQCDTPGDREQCVCTGTTFGTRTCQTDGYWSECDCDAPYDQGSGGIGGSESGIGGSESGIGGSGVGGYQGSGGAGVGGSGVGGTGVGGAMGSGGAVGTGGVMGTGGNVGIGGAIGLGGNPGTGGAVAVGGASTGGAGVGGAGTGGLPAAGGTGTGGSSGNGGVAGAGQGGTALGGAGGGSAGTSGGTAGSAGAGSPDYAPCPETGPCKIMPFGDSITEGCCNFVGGYRVELFRHALQDGHDITFVGSVSNGPTTVDGVPFPRDHEGHGGYTIDDEPARGTNGISPFVDTSLPSYVPDIITLMIGTNDINGNIDVADAPNRLGTLLDSIHAQDPDILVVLAQIIPTTNDGTNQAVQTYNAAMPALVSDRVALGHHLLLVDMYTAFTQDANYKNTLLSDGLHPNDAGYALMGQTWYAAISDYLR